MFGGRRVRSRSQRRNRSTNVRRNRSRNGSRSLRRSRSRSRSRSQNRQRQRRTRRNRRRQSRGGSERILNGECNQDEVNQQFTTSDGKTTVICKKNPNIEDRYEWTPESSV